MGFHYEEILREGQTLDVLTDLEAGLRIIVSRHGAEMVSLARRKESGEWVGFLYRDGDVSVPESGWKNHATVMGYHVHRLKERKSIYCGQEMQGGVHGFIQHKTFEAPQVSLENGILRYQLPYAGILPHEYPFRVGFDLTYRLHLDKLHVQFFFTNYEVQRAAHLSFGLHPGFGVTDLKQCRLTLPGGAWVRHAAPGNLLSGEKQYVEFPAGSMPFSLGDLPGALLLEPKKIMQPLVILEDPPSGRRVEVDLTGVPYLSLWGDGNPFICIEPCWGLPDHHQARHFENKEGIQSVAPRGTLTKLFSISPQWMPL